MPSLIWVSPPSSKNIVLSVPFQIRVAALTPFVCVCVHRCMEVNVHICVHTCGTQRKILGSFFRHWLSVFWDRISVVICRLSCSPYKILCHPGNLPLARSVGLIVVQIIDVGRPTLCRFFLFLSWGPGLCRKEKVKWSQTFISSWFLICLQCS